MTNNPDFERLLLPQGKKIIRSTERLAGTNFSTQVDTSHLAVILIHDKSDKSLRMAFTAAGLTHGDVEERLDVRIKRPTGTKIKYPKNQPYSRALEEVVGNVIGKRDDLPIPTVDAPFIGPSHLLRGLLVEWQTLEMFLLLSSG